MCSPWKVTKCNFQSHIYVIRLPEKLLNLREKGDRIFCTVLRMGPTKVVADGWLCGKDATERGGLTGGVV